MKKLSKLCISIDSAHLLSSTTPQAGTLCHGKVMRNNAVEGQRKDTLLSTIRVLESLFYLFFYSTNNCSFPLSMVTMSNHFNYMYVFKNVLYVQQKE